MRSICTVLVLAAALALLSGCETMDSTWVATKGYYKEYVNPDPAVDYQAVDWNSSEEKMAGLFTPVDKPVDLLGVYLNRQDRYPTDEWARKLFESYPWISGMAVVTMEGDIVQQDPETSLKPLNIEPALAPGQDLTDRRLRSYVDMSPMGPEVYLVTGMFKGNDLAGVILVHFDIRNIVQFCPQPDDLIIMTPENVVWHGGDAGRAEALRNRPWVEVLAEETEGRITEGGTEYVWMTRYVGDNQILYFTEAVEGGDDEEGFSFFGWF